MLRKSNFLVLFLITSATLILELSMTRLFSVVMYYHFAFLAISLALFGLGASGLYLYLRQHKYPEARTTQTLSVTAALFGVSIVVSLLVSLSQAISIDYSTNNILRLTLIYVFSLIPFFFSGLIVSLILFHGALDISRLYFFDLAGAALGALATVPLLNLLGAINTQLLAATLAGFAAVIAAQRAGGTIRLLGYATTVILAGLLVVNLTSPLFSVRYAKGQERELIEFQKWNAFSFITVQGVSGEQTAKAIDIDADARTYIVRDPFGGFGINVIKNEIAKAWVSHVPNVLLSNGEVLIIGPGGGIDVVFALAWGAKAIDAVEINPIIVNDVMLGKYREFSGRLYDRPEVTVYNSEGRSFVARSDKSYDMIQLTLVDTWAASSAGAFSLSENNLYTIEAFHDYIKHLKPDGIVAVTRWLSKKPKEGLRLMAIALESARKAGITDAAKHIAIVGSSSTGNVDQEMMTFLFKKSPFTEGELVTLATRMGVVNGRMVFSPNTADNSPFAQLANTGDVDHFIENYEYDITPTTDDRPFFFNTSKGADLKKIMLLEWESRKNNLGLFNLYLAGIISLALVVLFLICPLLLAKNGRAILRDFAAQRSLSYFVFIGLGFILVEIALMQKLILYLGHPVYALAVVLTSILIFAGTGSYFTKSYDHKTSRRRGNYIFPGMIFAIIIVSTVMSGIVALTFDMPLGIRIVIAAILVMPLGLWMGQPFPLELKHVEHYRREMIPWVWSLNGAASVLGSVAAIALAMAYGFTVVLWIGAGCYAAAFAMRGRG